MDVDLHVHTDYSDCSSLNYELIHEYIKRRTPAAITITDHGNVKACRRLAGDFPDLAVLWGIEVTTEEGDFLVFSEEKDYLSSLTVYHTSVRDIRRGDDTAIVWAHPRVSQSSGWESPDPISEEILRVTQHIDGIELFNGTMMYLATVGSVRPTYFDRLQQIASRQGLTCTAGSDAHDPAGFFKCFTRFPNGTATAADMIKALKQGKAEPHYIREHFDNLDIPVVCPKR